MKLLIATLVCWISIPVFAQIKYVPDWEIEISGDPGDFTISNYNTREVYAKHLKVDDIAGVFQGLIGFRQGTKFGFMNRYGKIICPPEFDAFDPEDETYGFSNTGPYLEVRKGDQLALLDSTGTYKVPFGNYGYLWDAGMGVCGAEQDGMFGLFKNGKLILPIEYPADYNTFAFNHETMIVTKDSLYGLINTSGKLVLPMEYTEITEENESYWLITKNNQVGLADYKGKIVVPCNLQMIYNVQDNLVFATKNDLYGVQNLDGTIVCPFEYDYLTNEPADGAIFAQKGGLWGIMQLKNPAKTQFIYENYFVPEWNKKNLAAVRKNGKTGMVNTKGEVIFDFVLDGESEQMNFQYGTAIVTQNGRVGMMMEYGRIAVPCEFDYLNIYSGFPQVTTKAGRYGVVDIDGEIMVPFEYDWVGNFAYDKDIYEVRKENKDGLYRAGDRLIIPVEYDQIILTRGFYEVAKDYKYGFYDEDGKAVLPCLFKEIFDFTPTTALVNKDGILRQYDLTTAREQKLAPDSTIQFETTAFLNFGKTYIQPSAWNDYFIKNPVTGTWYCIDKKTNALIGNPYYAIGKFDKQGNVAVSSAIGQDPFAINSKGEELKPHFHLNQGLVFETFILEDDRDSIIDQFKKQKLLQNQTPENYWDYIQSNYAIVTTPTEMYDDWGNALPAYYLNCYNKSSYFDSETPFPANPRYEYNFREVYSRVGPSNDQGYRWAIPVESDKNTEDTPDMDFFNVILVNGQGDVISKPNYYPAQSVPFYNVIFDHFVYWKDLKAYPEIIDSIQKAFPGTASLSDEVFLERYADSVHINATNVYNYDEYGEYMQTYAHSFYKTKNLQLFDTPPPANIENRFVIQDIHAAKGGESLEQPNDTRRFQVGSKTAYAFGARQFFAYPALEEGTSTADAHKRVDELLAKMDKPEVKADLQHFDYFSELIKAGMATKEYSNDFPEGVYNEINNEFEFELYSYTPQKGLALENEILVQPAYLSIAFDPAAGKFILVDSLFKVYSYDLEKRKTSELKDMRYCASNRDWTITRSEKTKRFDLYYSGAPRIDVNGPYETVPSPTRPVKNIKRLYYLQNCQSFVLSNEYGEDSMFVLDDGTLQFVSSSYCDTVVVGIYAPFPTAGDIGWYELADGTIYQFSGEKETQVQFSDFIKQKDIPINEYFFPDFRINETVKGLELKSEANQRILQISKEEYLEVAQLKSDQNGFGGIFRKGKFIPYSTMVPFPEKHSVYIHLSGPFWLVGEENALELVYLDMKTNNIPYRYPEKFTSYGNFTEKRQEIPENGEEVGPIELFMMQEN